MKKDKQVRKVHRDHTDNQDTQSPQDSRDYPDSQHYPGYHKSRRIILILLLVVAGGALYFAVDPSCSGWMPKCVFRMVTGWECPGCGSQRMLHAMLHGDIREAWHFNPFLFFMIPVIILYLLPEVMPGKFPKLFRILHSTGSIVCIAAAICAWWIGRNLI
ncbi:MAG: DUF2752 domain-containing protein [Muribaculaceae bacterium]|nr:DUF2752 domain-containing protein [Muribaculaceae bacterium]